MTDPYQVLGVPPTATDDEVKKAYRTLCKKYHPDANVGKPDAAQAEKKFMEVQQAYEEIMHRRQGGGARAGSGYNGPQQQSAGGGYASSEQFQDIREMIRRGLILQAAEALGRIQNRTAEWYYLSGLVYMRQGMYSRAQQAFQTAANMEPDNAEYRQAAEQMGGVYQQTHSRTMGGGNDLLCNLCQCMACMSLCGGGRLFCCF